MHNFKLIQCIVECIMAFAVCPIAGEQAEHGFDAEATLQAASGATIGVSGNLGVVLAIGGKAHDVVPVKITQLRQMVAVEAGIVGENGTDSVLIEPGTQIKNSLGSGAENRLHWCFDEQSAFVHAADLTLNGQNVIFGFNQFESVCICNDGSDTHDLVCPVGFCVNDSKFAHVFLSLVVYVQYIGKGDERQARLTKICTAINKEKAVSILNGMLTVKLLSLSIGRNRGEVTEVVAFTAVGDGFQVFCIAPVGDADTGDLTLLCHIYRLMFLHNGVIGKLIPGNSAAFSHKTDIRLALEFACGI